MPNENTEKSPGKSAATGAKASADVSMNLTEFNAFSTGRFCVLGVPGQILPLTISQGGHGKGISHKGGNPFNNGVNLKKSGKITFGVQSFVPGRSFQIVGSFWLPQTAGASVDENFENIAWDATELTFKATGKSKAAGWQLFVAITDSSSGALGIIDPDIENDATITKKRPG